MNYILRIEYLMNIPFIMPLNKQCKTSEISKVENKSKIGQKIGKNCNWSILYEILKSDNK